MFRRIAWFEFRYQLQQPVFIVTSLVFFLLTFLSVAVDNIQIGSTDAIKANSPFAVTQTILLMSLFGMFIPLAMLANIVLRDTESKMAGIMHALPIGKYPFLTGRFVGAFAVVCIAFSATCLGMIIGSFMWWLDPETLGPFRPWDYVHVMLTLAIPNLLLTGAIFFAVATATRSLLLTYASLIALLVIYFSVRAIFSDPADRDMMALLDPFGLSAMGNVVRYWTISERNSQLVPLSGELLLNRAIWVGAALTLAGLTIWRFSFAERSPKGRKADDKPAASGPVTLTLPRATPQIGWATALTQLRLRTRFEVTAVMKSAAFIILVALGVFNAGGILLRMQALYGTDIYPVTREVVRLLSGTFGIVPLIVSVYYAGELVWRERQVKLHEIIDATPSPNWVFVLSKFAAMILVLTVLLVIAGIVGISAQLARGYTDIEIGLYVSFLFGVALYQTLLFAVLSLFLQVLSGNKYLGMLAAVGWIIASLVLQGLGLEDNLLFYGATPAVPLSDMNGMGHFGVSAFWFSLYWSFAAIILVQLSYRGWSRGTIAPFRQRFSMLGQGWDGRQLSLTAVCLTAFIGVGGFIFYNTHILNNFRTSDEREEAQVEYEKRFRQYEKLPQPRIIDVRTDADIFPAERRMEVHGHYILENKTGGAISDVHLLINPDAKVVSLALEGAASTKVDEDYNYHIVTLTRPMQPGEKLRLDFKTQVTNPGFENEGGSTEIVGNGSFINNMAVAPHIGFAADLMIQSPATRRKHELPPIDRMPPLEDMAERRNNYLRSDSDFVTFESIVSTSADQIAVAPGYLQREWVEGDRRYFHYKMDAPILNFYSWLSARYEVKSDKWNDVDISVYYHKPHYWNVDRMIEATKTSLDYFSKAFGPYQHRQMRILEFPDYAKFAQAFPNTVPYSEGIGFIANNSDPDKIDYLFYVTAHEVAHQWWAHQVMGANVQGSTLLSETLAQYSALMVMEKAYGPDKIRRFLKYELDTYLRSRGGEDRAEMPLVRVENQGYIHYRKGAVIMYHLSDQLGEDVVNRALARLVKETGYQSAPYPTSLDLIRILKDEAGSDKAGLIEDALEKITLYDLKASDARVEALPDGQHKVTLTIAASKAELDGEGKETKVPLRLPIDIGLFTASPADDGFDASKVILLEKREIDDATGTVEIITDRTPTHVGIDPYNKLIDRNSDDNITKVSVD